MAFDLNTLLSSELHDIKNQMQALLSVQDYLAEQLTELPKFNDLVASIQNHSQVLNHKFIELLSVLKMQNQGFKLNVDEHWLIDTLTPIIHEIKKLHNLDVILDFDPEFNGFYDDQLLEIALHNVLINAKSAGASLVNISVIEHANGSWVINLQDDGPGFEPEQLEQGEFQPHGSQSGLGLYLISQSLQAHQRNDKRGQVLLSNSDHSGAIVQLIFP